MSFAGRGSHQRRWGSLREASVERGRERESRLLPSSLGIQVPTVAANA
jgi:hypothetical protein